jgi:invasion protein IalB
MIPMAWKGRSARSVVRGAIALLVRYLRSCLRDAALPTGVVYGVAACLLAGIAATPQAGATSSQAPVTPAGIQRETFQDWQVACAPSDGKRRCAVLQQQAGQAAGGTGARQRLFAIELIPAGAAATGTLILPFGLDLAKGVSLKVGDKASAPAIAFRTCIPAGCIVPLEFGAQAVSALRTAPLLSATITEADNGRVSTLPISLKGLAQALDRARQLSP